MKKAILFFSLLLIAMLVFSACDAGDVDAVADAAKQSTQQTEQTTQNEEEKKTQQETTQHVCTESDWIIDIEATCLINGIRHTQCVECKNVMLLEKISALGHNYEVIQKFPATCLEDEVVDLVCANCGQEKVEEIAQSRLGHNFVNYVSDGNATCISDGTKTATCSRCTQTDTVPDVNSKLGHDFANYVSNANATCTADGTKTAQCTRCPATDTVVDVGSAGHRFATEWSFNNESHWHAAICGHTDEETTEPHTVVEGVCSTCGCKFCQSYQTGDTFESNVQCVNSSWNKKERLIMNISDSSNNGEMQAGGRAYVSGKNNYTSESAKITAKLLKKVIQRNSDAAAYANVSLAYSYSDWGWGQATGKIAENIASGASDMPDIYYDSVYDMVASSIKGNFLNVLGNDYYQGAGAKAAAGYNRDYMDVMTFSTQAEYLIASDYSVDISRSFYILPVNMTVLTNKASVVVDDRDGNKVVDVNDFFDVIDDSVWTWNFIAQLCESVKQEAAASGGYNINEGVVGMAIDGSAGLAAAGLCYASELQIIDRKIVDGEYVYEYETEGAALEQVATVLYNSIHQTDAFVVNFDSNGYASSTEAIAYAFSDNHVLIGNVILLGAIEHDFYRYMWDPENDCLGFVVAPMPLYTKGTAGEWGYHTVVHNLAKVFGIATTSQSKLNRAVAFIDYASRNSTDILYDFYEWTILLDAANGDTHNVTYLTNMKENMGCNLDLIVDDALGAVGGTYAKVEGTNYYSSRWHILLRDAGAEGTYGIGAGIVPLYESLYTVKQTAVTKIQEQFVKVSQ